MTDQEQFAADAASASRARNGEKLTPDEKKLLVHMAGEGDVLHDGFSRPKSMSAKRAEVAVLGLESKGSLWCSCFQDSNRAERKYIGDHVYRVRLFQPRKRRKTTSDSVQNDTLSIAETPMNSGVAVLQKREVALGIIRGSEDASERIFVSPRKGGRPRVAKPLSVATRCRRYRQKQKDVQRARRNAA